MACFQAASSARKRWRYSPCSTLAFARFACFAVNDFGCNINPSLLVPAL
jgi:hypothetical protein